MSDRCPICALEIVAYAEHFDQHMLPAIAPPVYRIVAETNRYLVPPFHEADGFLYNATEIPQAEFDDLVAQGRITSLPAPVRARIAHELWFDLAFGQHYQPIAVARDRLGAIAQKAIDAAERALECSKLTEAERETGIAIRADSRRVEPYAIRAAIRLSEGKQNAIRTMRMLAPPAVGEAAFTAEVLRYRARLPGQPKRRSPMYQVAAERPQRAA